MTKTFTTKDKLYTFTVTECTALRIVDFDFGTGEETIERQDAILVEWENTRGEKLTALFFGDMPNNDTEFRYLFEDEMDYSTDPEIMKSIKLKKTYRIQAILCEADNRGRTRETITNSLRVEGDYQEALDHLMKKHRASGSFLYNVLDLETGELVVSTKVNPFRI